MDKQRIGELLGRMGQLSSHDIDEILAEQRLHKKRFGAIAVQLGFCQPEHIREAWSSQLTGDHEVVDLHEVGIDAQAIECLPSQIALGLRAMPIRLCEGQLIVAVSDPKRAAEVSALAQRIGMSVKCVMANHEQIEAGLTQYYSNQTVQ